MNKWIMLVAGPVIFGACSMKRQVENRRTSTAELSAVETHSSIWRDSLAGSLGRVFRLDRRCVTREPNTGVVYRYDERIYIDETAQIAGGRVMHEAVTAQREEHTKTEEHRSVGTQSKVRRLGWWWLAAFGLLALWVIRWFRFWPFK